MILYFLQVIQGDLMIKWSDHQMMKYFNDQWLVKLNIHYNMKNYDTDCTISFCQCRWRCNTTGIEDWTFLCLQINNDPNILPDIKLVMRWSDTRGETTEATKAMIDMICDGVAAFFGPEGSCYVEAIVSQARNIPMISYVSTFYYQNLLLIFPHPTQNSKFKNIIYFHDFQIKSKLEASMSKYKKWYIFEQELKCETENLQKCSDYKASKVNTFARTEPPDTQVTKSVIALLLHYGWNKFTIITESAWRTVARSLEEQAAEYNLTVNHYRTVEDRHTCCEERLPCCQVSVWFQLIQETKNMTRS